MRGWQEKIRLQGRPNQSDMNVMQLFFLCNTMQVVLRLQSCDVMPWPPE